MQQPCTQRQATASFGSIQTQPTHKTTIFFRHYNYIRLLFTPYYPALEASYSFHGSTSSAQSVQPALGVSCRCKLTRLFKRPCNRVKDIIKHVFFDALSPLICHILNCIDIQLRFTSPESEGVVKGPNRLRPTVPLPPSLFPNK